jgi:hypothetical protein
MLVAGKRRREVETGFKDTALIGCSAARPAGATSAEDAKGAASAPDSAAQEEECGKELAAGVASAGRADACGAV